MNHHVRHFERVKGRSATFWRIFKTDWKVWVTYGRIGTAGQMKARELDLRGQAHTYYDTLIASKLAEGYREVDPAAQQSDDYGGRTLAALTREVGFLKGLDKGLTGSTSMHECWRSIGGRTLSGLPDVEAELLRLAGRTGALLDKVKHKAVVCLECSPNDHKGFDLGWSIANDEKEAQSGALLSVKRKSLGPMKRSPWLTALGTARVPAARHRFYMLAFLALATVRIVRALSPSGRFGVGVVVDEQASAWLGRWNGKALALDLKIVVDE